MSRPKRQKFSHLLSQFKLQLFISSTTHFLSFLPAVAFYGVLFGLASIGLKSEAQQLQCAQLWSSSKPHKLSEKVSFILAQVEQNPAPLADKTRITFKAKDNPALNYHAAQIVYKAHRIFGKFHVKTLNVLVNSHATKYDSHFNRQDKELVIGVRNRGSKEEISSPIFIHELYHAVFEEHLKVRFDGEVLTFAQLQKRPNELMKYLDEHEGTKEDYDELLVKLNKTSKLLFLLPAYDEVFADLASALYHNDGSILARLLEPRTKDIKQRNFDHIQSFKNYKPKDETYSFFDPSRAALWRLLQKNLNPNATPETILQAYLLATQDHIEMRVSQDNLVEPEKLNQEFFRLFVTHGQALKLWNPKNPEQQ